MRGTRIALGMAAALLVLVAAAPAGATAAGRDHHTTQASRLAVITFPGTHGYRVGLTMFEVEPRPHLVLGLIAERGRESGEYTTTRRLHVAADGSIAANLPGVGRINLAFEPTDTDTQPDAQNCTGRDPIVTSGYFRGRIDFRGRRGFTSVHRRSARGLIAQNFRQTCPGHGRRARTAGLRDAALNFLQLSAQRQQGHVTTGLLVTDSHYGEAGAEPSLVGHAFEVDRGVTFLSTVEAENTVEPVTVADSKSLGTATLSPPAPFTGTAEYRALGSKRSSWTGDLAVELPGFGLTSLAGPAFDSSLCLDKRCTGNPQKSGGNSALFSFVGGLSGS